MNKKKMKKPSTKSGRARKRTKTTAPAKAPPRGTAPTGKDLPETQRFVRDLLVRGEATKLTKSGKLPLQATHVIKKLNPDGSAQVERLRYKSF
jgi:hypothetical protein